jgi:hypothetical protein
VTLSPESVNQKRRWGWGLLNTSSSLGFFSGTLKDQASLSAKSVKIAEIEAADQRQRLPLGFPRRSGTVVIAYL